MKEINQVIDIVTHILITLLKRFENPFRKNFLLN